MEKLKKIARRALPFFTVALLLVCCISPMAVRADPSYYDTYIPAIGYIFTPNATLPQGDSHTVNVNFTSDGRAFTQIIFRFSDPTYGNRPTIHYMGEDREHFVCYWNEQLDGSYTCYWIQFEYQTLIIQEPTTFPTLFYAWFNANTTRNYDIVKVPEMDIGTNLDVNFGQVDSLFDLVEAIPHPDFDGIFDLEVFTTEAFNQVVSLFTTMWESQILLSIISIVTAFIVVAFVLLR